MKRAAQSAFLLAASLSIFSARAEPPLYAEQKTPIKNFSWIDEIRKNVPVLKHDRGDMLPMILWVPDPGPADLQAPEYYKDLLARGLTEHIDLDEQMIPIAQALKAAGSPIIMMKGRGGTWPAELAGDPGATPPGDPKEWQHQFDAGFTPKEPAHACPALLTGWALNARHARATLQKFKDAGLTVDAVWMDWEGDPIGGAERYEQALHCARCRATLPPEALASARNFSDYSWRRYMDLGGAYLAAPVLEVFPDCSVTNWRVTVSTKERPVRNWEDVPYGPVVPPFFTASNPVAYGNTVSWTLWKPQYKLDREHVDQFYTYLLLNETSDDAANRLIWTPERKSVPWVCRWWPDDPNPKIPIMSRERYREVLRHLWLRGIIGMQIFNPQRDGFEEIAVTEVADTVAVYDEMLAYKEFIQNGTPIGLDLPKIQDSGVVWSGLRWGDKAIVRAFKQGSGKEAVTIEPWKGSKITLTAPAEGKTWQLVLKDKKISVAD
ncbi:MAG TPA: hypothetical protein VG733_18735 [Chthoniobacteraceae bacterium]|nr:hypothetical protein [Chthoniobacteraceae bacterium]